MNRPSGQRVRFLLILLMVLSLALWCYLFRFFLNGSAPLQGDAHSYFGHIRFYLENITRGVYPLWNPLEDYGAVNEFSMRRIGEFNPFLLIAALLNKCGLSFVAAYRLFLALYFLGGVAGFYLLSQRLFRDRLSSFTASLLMLFSCLGAGIFESYLLLEIVLYIWFSYFLVAFMQDPRRVFFLGAVFSLMLINITYIPFYFYTVLSVFCVCFLAVYAPRTGTMLREVMGFAGRHAVFTWVCTAFLAASLVPGILWYQQSRHGESLTLQRHTGSQDENPATLSIGKINEGGIIPNFIFDRQFVNIDKVGVHNIYISLFAFLMLFAGAWGRLNRRLVVLFVFGYTVFLIGLADASHVHRFLYQHIPFFKFFRNVQFFLQLAILPVFILFVVEQMRIFIEDCREGSLNRLWMSGWVVMVHAAALAFFLYNHTGYLTCAVVLINLGWMLGHIWRAGPGWIWILFLWGSIVLQPLEVYSRIAADYPPSPQGEYSERYSLALPSAEDARKLMGMEESVYIHAPPKEPPYFGTRWVYEAIGSINNGVLIHYQSAPFLVYDRLRQVTDKNDYSPMQEAMSHFDNIAFVHTDLAKDTGGGLAPPKVRILTSADKDFEFLKYDANDVIVRTNFARRVFLVRTQNYHSHWKVFIDGKPAPLLRTDICFQGLWVPAGEHVVHWRFGGPLRYLWAYFLVVLYLFIPVWCLWLSLT